MSIPNDDMHCSDQNDKYIIVALADEDDHKNCTRSRTDCCLSIVAHLPKWTTVESGDRKAV